MNPLEDTLNIGPTMPRQVPSDRPTSNDLINDLDLQQTVRMPGAGTLVFGRYRLQRVLGRGGMGVVWLAVDTKLERAVALKFLPDAVGIDPVALKELKEETRRGLDLAHPNIVRIYDFVDDADGAAAISMEFVDGKSLSERRIVQPHHVFTVDQIGPWMGQMCDALDYAHLQKRIVHRDLKPANLMVNSESHIKITDFGISCSLSDTMSRLSRAQQNAGTSGTLLYMSPQQAMGDRPRPTDDIYAVGATLYELLTGKPPFYRGDITTQITGKTAPKLKDRREELEIAATDDIPKQWEDAIAACLDKDPARRPQTAGELAQMLGVSLRAEAHKPQTLTGNPISSGLRQIDVQSTSRSEPEEKAPASPMVKWLIAATITILLLAGLGGGGLWWWTNRPGEWAVETSPPGAQVTVGTKTVKAPAVISELKPGTHEAKVTMEGYEPKTVGFKVVPGKKVDIGPVELERSTGSVTVSSDPDGIPFEVHSTSDPKRPVETGETPRTLRLPLGDYEVVLRYEGETKSQNVTVVRNNDVPKLFKFEKPAPPAPPPAPVIAQTPAPAPPQPMPSSADTPPPSTAANPAPTPPPAPAAAAPAPAPAPAAPGPAPASPNVGAMLASNTPAPGAPGTSMPGPPGTGLGAGLNPQTGTPPADPNATPPAANPAVPANPIAGAGSGPNMAALSAAQPVVGEPEKGYWEIEDLFLSSTYNGFSENGRRNVLYQAQRKLKISADGKPGKTTHKKIQEFQTSKALQPTGQLDGPTLLAMGLDTVADNSSWSAPRPSSSGRSGGSGRTPESEKTWFRKQFERNVLGGRDLKEAFRKK